MEKKTPLYEKHVALGGKIVPFAGYLLPVQYPNGVIAEHMAVRTHAGLFDVSHMGEVLFEGEDALSNLNRLMTNDFTSMKDGAVRYSPMCYDNGGCVDDLLVYRYSLDKYMVVINASNREKDVEWIKSHLNGKINFTDISDDFAQVALQGPEAKTIISELTDSVKLPCKYYTFADNIDVGGVICIVSQTGYTGSGGYELYCKTADAEKLWDAILDAGRQFGLIPCGLGARDTLRLEAAMPLYGHEIDENITPYEACLDFAVKLGKPDFIGKNEIINRMPISRKRVGLKMTGRGIAREHQDIFSDNEKIGVTTSGTYCPYLGGAYAMALINKAYSEIGTELEVDVRGRRIEAEVVPLPFFKNN